MKALLATAIAASALIASAAQAATLTLTFQGIEQPTGTVMAAVFDSADAYGGRGAPVRAVRVEVTGATATATVEGLPAGRYAIKAFHDLDGDGQMDTNPFGLPTEPYAFSNDAAASMGPATFEAAAFAVGEGDATHAITIR